MRPDPRRRGAPGFAVAAMLVLIAIIALATGGALQDVLFAQQLSGTRLLQQRAMGMAELGLRVGASQLARTPGVPADTATLRPGTQADDSLDIQLQPGEARLAEGYSAGLFVERDYELHSTGRSARGAQRVLVQGMVRLEGVEVAP